MSKGYKYMTTGRGRIEAALSREGAREIPVVVCYEGIYIRDHWPEFDAGLWWVRESADLAAQMAWRSRVIERTGQDWFELPVSLPRDERAHTVVTVRRDGVYHLNRRTGRAVRLREPRVGGWTAAGVAESVRPERLAATPDEVDARVPVAAHDVSDAMAAGCGDLALAMLRRHGDLYPIRHVASPLWSCYSLWGFEGMMTMIAERPDLVAHACRRFLERALQDVAWAAALSAAGIWIEECLTDMISPAAFRRLNLPYLRPLVEAIGAAGMKSIYYYCGNPAGKWDLLLDVGADALALEEGKKDFCINIEEVIARVAGRCTVLGNLDAIHVLSDASEDKLRVEIARQIAAGRRNGSRFIMSIGSPVTPSTPVSRVRRYCDLARALGK